MKLPTRAALGAAMAAVLAAGCEDVPLVPKWDSDWYLPVASEAIRLSRGFPTGVPIPNGTSASVADTSVQGLDESIGQLLKREIRTARMIVTFSKSATLTFAIADTLIVAGSQADISNTAAQRIVVPLTLAATATSTTDTSSISSGAISMLQQVAEAGADLYVVLRGRLTCQNAAGCTISTSDSIGVKLAMLARIGVSTPGTGN